MIAKSEVLKRASQLKLAIFDVDGVFTDGRLYFDPQGQEHKVFHVHDGLGIKLLQQAGIAVAIISSRSSQAVQLRMQDLGIGHIYQGQADKTPAFNELQRHLQLTVNQIAYTGDDLPDLPLIIQAGLGICVANAHPLLREHAHWQTQASGGAGAVREICELILQAQGQLQSCYAHYR